MKPQSSGKDPQTRTRKLRRHGKRTKRVVCIVQQVEDLIAMEAHWEGSELKIHKIIHIPYSRLDDKPRVISRRLRESLRKAKIRSRKARLAIFPGDLKNQFNLLRHQVPRSASTKQKRGIAQVELRNRLHEQNKQRQSIKITDLKLSHEYLPSHQGLLQDVVTVSVPRVQVEYWESILRKAGLQPEFCTLLPFALKRKRFTTQHRIQKAVTMYLYFVDIYMLIAFKQDDGEWIVHQRLVQTARFQAEINTDADSETNAKIERIDRILNDTKLSLHNFNKKYQPFHTNQAILCGQGDLQALRKALEETLGIPVKCYEEELSVEYGPWKDHTIATTNAACFGLMMDMELSHQVNLLPKKSFLLEYFKTTTAVLVALIILLGLWNFQQYEAIVWLKQNIQQQHELIQHRRVAATAARQDQQLRNFYEQIEHLVNPNFFREYQLSPLAFKHIGQIVNHNNRSEINLLEELRFERTDNRWRTTLRGVIHGDDLSSTLVEFDRLIQAFQESSLVTDLQVPPSPKMLGNRMNYDLNFFMLANANTVANSSLDSESITERPDEE